MQRLLTPGLLTLAGLSLQSCGQESLDTSLQVQRSLAPGTPNFLALIPENPVLDRRISANFSGFTPVQEAQLKDIILLAHTVFSASAEIADREIAKKITEVPIKAIPHGDRRYPQDSYASWNAAEKALYVRAKDTQGQTIPYWNPELMALTFMHEGEHAVRDFPYQGKSAAESWRYHFAAEARTHLHDARRAECFSDLTKDLEHLPVAYRSELVEAMSLKSQVSLATTSQYQLQESLMQIIIQIHEHEESAHVKFLSPDRQPLSGILNQLASYNGRTLRAQESIIENTLLAIEKSITSFRSQGLNTAELFKSMSRCREILKKFCERVDALPD